MTDVADAAAEHADDAVIQVEVVDADDNDAVANVAVRLNQAPMITAEVTTLNITVGTQVPADAPAEALANYNTVDDEIVCVALNVCTVTLAADDPNNQDTTGLDVP